MAGVVYCIFLHQGDLSVVGCRDVCSVLYIVCFLHQDAFSGVGRAERICVSHTVCSCIKVPLAVSGGRMHGGCGVFCMFLHQGAFSGVACRDVCSVSYIVSSLHQGALSGVGCVERICVMHAVCSCIKVPLAVSGAKIHGRHGVFFASRCL